MPNQYYKGPRTRNFDGTRFFNPGEPTTDRTLAEMLRWQISGTRSRWPASQALTRIVPEPCVKGLRITMVGHATLLIQMAGLNFLTDPAASWVVEESIKVPPPRIQVPGVKDPAADDQITLTMDGVGYSLNSGARYGSRVSSTIRFTSNLGTPLAAWVEESLQKLAPCWSHSPRQP